MGAASAVGSRTEELVLTVPAEPGTIAMARMFAGSVARHFWLDEELVDDIKIAISEACTNAVKAHMDAAVPHPVRIVVYPEGRTLCFEVTDNGPGFDPADRAGRDEGTPPMGLFEGSLGLVLIRSLFESCEIRRNPQQGMTVRFTVDIPEAYGRAGSP